MSDMMYNKEVIVGVSLSPEPNGINLDYIVSISFRAADFPLPNEKYISLKRSNFSGELNWVSTYISGKMNKYRNPYGVRLVKITKSLFLKILSDRGNKKSGLIVPIDREFVSENSSRFIESRLFLNVENSERDLEIIRKLEEIISNSMVYIVC